MNQTGEATLPHDIYGLALYPGGLPAWVWILALGALALAAFAIFWWKRRQKKASSKPPVDPWKVLFDDLQSLAPESPFHQERQKEFYYQLSMTVRRMIEKRTGLRATDMTLDELRARLRARLPLPESVQSDIEAFLERADMVKFADVEVKLAQAEGDLRAALVWYESLRPLSIHQDTKLYTGAASQRVQA